MTQTRKRATSNKRFGHKKNLGNLRLSVRKRTKRQYPNRQVGGIPWNLEVDLGYLMQAIKQALDEIFKIKKISDIEKKKIYLL